MATPLEKESKVPLFRSSPGGGGAVTVRVAEFEVALPSEFVAIALYDPLSDGRMPVIVRVLVVAPDILPAFERLVVPFCHCIEGVG